MKWNVIFCFCSLTFSWLSPLQLGLDQTSLKYELQPRSLRVRRGICSNWPKSHSDSSWSESHEEEVITGLQQWETSSLPSCPAGAAIAPGNLQGNEVHPSFFSKSSHLMLGRCTPTTGNVILLLCCLRSSFHLSRRKEPSIQWQM